MDIKQIGAYEGNYTKGRPGWDGFFLIVLHTMEGYLAGCDSWFNNPDSHVSTHYGVGLNGETHQYVSEDDTAYANGQDYANRNGISIEFEDNQNPQDSVRTNEMYEAGAQLIAYICKRRNIACNTAGIKKHNEFVEKVCPGALDCDRLIRRANEILNPLPTPEPAPIPQPPLPYPIPEKIYSQDELDAKVNPLEKQIADFQKSIWYQFYLLFNRNAKN